MRLRGQLELAGVSAAIVTALASVIVATGLAAGMPHATIVFAVFGAATMALTIQWIKHDAVSAFDYASQHAYIGFDDVDPTRIVSIAKDCPKSWRVLLHIRLHPEMIDDEARD